MAPLLERRGRPVLLVGLPVGTRRGCGGAEPGVVERTDRVRHGRIGPVRRIPVNPRERGSELESAAWTSRVSGSGAGTCATATRPRSPTQRPSWTRSATRPSGSPAASVVTSSPTAPRVLDATERVVVATGILNLWMHEPADVADGHHTLTTAHPGRFLLGIGVSHASLIDRVVARSVRHAAGRDPRVPRRARRHGHTRAARRAGARRTRTEDARPRARPHRGRASLPRHAGALGARARGARPRRAAVARAVGRARDRPGRRTRRCARTHLAIYLTLPNYTETGAGSASTTTTSPTAGATDSSTRSWPGETRPPSRAVCRPTSTQAPTTCASRSCPTVGLHATSGDGSHRRSSICTQAESAPVEDATRHASATWPCSTSLAMSCAKCSTADQSVYS